MFLVKMPNEDEVILVPRRELINTNIILVLSTVTNFEANITSCEKCWETS